MLITCTYTHHSHRFGPLRNQWCMRFEAKNAQIKSFVGKNFKNLPYTVAIKHQHYMCLQLNSAPGLDKSNFLYKGDEIGKGMLFQSFSVFEGTYTIVIIIFLITGFTANLVEFPQAARRVIEEQFPSSTVYNCPAMVRHSGYIYYMHIHLVHKLLS